MNESIVDEKEKSLDLENQNASIRFMNKLLNYYNNKKHNEIEKILIGNTEEGNKKIYDNYSKSDDNSKYNNENDIINVRVWVNDETKKLLKLLHYLCKDESMVICLNNKIMNFWLFETSTEMSLFFHKGKKVEINQSYRPAIKVDKYTYSEFMRRCNLLGISSSQGLNMCVNNFIEQKAKLYL